jgi:nucleoside-diphosphate-sugar epimerase
MKLLVTGHDGFIGTHLCPHLQKEYEVFYLKSDLRDHKGVASEVELLNPNIIVHLASRTEVEKSFYEQISFSDINYLGTINLIESAVKLKNLKKFVFASTMEVYGWQPISDEVKALGVPRVFEVFDENTIPNPNAPYAVAKYGCEKYLEYVHRAFDFPFTIIRQTNSYGRPNTDFFVTESIISKMLRSDDKVSLGYAEPYRNFIHVEDTVQAWLSVIGSNNVLNKILTVGPNDPIKIKDYAQKIAAKLNWQGEIEWNARLPRPGEIYYLNSDIKLINSLTGWAPKITLDQGIEKTIELWQQKL